MKIHFNTDDLEDLYHKRLAKLGKQQYSREVIQNYRKKIDLMVYANDLGDIAKFKGLNLEKLKGSEYKGCYSIRVNKQYRIIFKEARNGQIEILILELSKHYE